MNCKICNHKQDNLIRGICDYCGGRQPRWNEQRWVDKVAEENAGLFEDAERAAEERAKASQ